MGTDAVVIRGHDVLVTEDGRLPAFEAVSAALTPIDHSEYAGLTVVRSWTGEVPDGWRWVPVIEFQSYAEAGLSNTVGEALLCS